MELRDRIKDFRRVKARDLKGAPWNWRAHGRAQRQAVLGSIEELGFFDPLDARELPDGTLELVDGHLRQDIVNAAVGPDTLIPVIVTDFTEAEAKKASLLKDPLAGLAEADAGRLDALLREVTTESAALQEILSTLGQEPDALPSEDPPLRPRGNTGEAGPAPPADFPEYGEDIEVEHCCPRCGYRWSGNPA